MKSWVVEQSTNTCFQKSCMDERPAFQELVLCSFSFLRDTWTPPYSFGTASNTEAIELLKKERIDHLSVSQLHLVHPKGA